MGVQFPGAESLWGRQISVGTPNGCGDAEKSQQCHMYSLQCSTYTSENLSFDYGGAKLDTCPGRHLTSYIPGRYT